MNDNPVTLNIEAAKIGEGGARFEDTLPVSLLELDNEPCIRVNKPIAYTLFAQIASHELIIQGSVTVDVELECSRCAEFFSTSVTDSSFLRVYELDSVHDVVNIAEDIREELLVHIPSFPLCSDQCRGLCDQCGKNLNQGACDCKKEVEDFRWNDLDRLKLEKR